MGDLIVKGGWVMAPILAGSVIALTLVVDRLWYFWSIRTHVSDFAGQVQACVSQNRLDEALEICKKSSHPLARVYEVGLGHAGEETQELDRVMEREANRQVQYAEKNLGFLLIVIGVEPLLGFLGTILGLIQAFMAWEKLSTAVTVSALAAGIYQAMITTAAGLIVSIPYFVIYHVLTAKVDDLAKDLNHFGDELLSQVYKSGKSQGAFVR